METIDLQISKQNFITVVSILKKFTHPITLNKSNLSPKIERENLIITTNLGHSEFAKLQT